MLSIGFRNLGVGLLVCVIGIAVTAGSYAAASNGGHYMVAYGAILFGGVQALKGVFQVISHGMARAIGRPTTTP